MCKIPRVVFGAAEVGVFDEKQWEEMKVLLQKNRITELDTAFGYNGSEESLGRFGAPKVFTIHSKAPGFAPGSMTRNSILSGMTESLRRLGTERVHTYLFHSPDSETPIEESLAAISQLYQEGKFKKFGLSNFEPADVQKIYDIQRQNGHVLPTVYQGNYNAVARSAETALIPVLRKLNISFDAYSPIAGGFLAKEPSSFRSGETTGRFAPSHFGSGLYNTLYSKPSLLEALDTWKFIAEDIGVSMAELAYRWVSYHGTLDYTKGDGIVIGARTLSQLQETLNSISRGPLPWSAVEGIEAIWQTVRDEAPIDNYNSYFKSTVTGLGERFSTVSNQETKPEASQKNGI